LNQRVKTSGNKFNVSQRNNEVKAKDSESKSSSEDSESLGADDDSSDGHVNKRKHQKIQIDMDKSPAN